MLCETLIKNNHQTIKSLLLEAPVERGQLPLANGRGPHRVYLLELQFQLVLLEAPYFQLEPRVFFLVLLELLLGYKKLLLKLQDCLLLLVVLLFELALILLKLLYLLLLNVELVLHLLDVLVLLRTHLAQVRVLLPD